ncbi:hypothetical protein ACQP2K_37230 [Microbispora siamensis]
MRLLLLCGVVQVPIMLGLARTTDPGDGGSDPARKEIGASITRSLPASDC